MHFLELESFYLNYLSLLLDSFSVFEEPKLIKKTFRYFSLLSLFLMSSLITLHSKLGNF